MTTEKLFVISQSQIDELFSALHTGSGRLATARRLQALPQLSTEPVLYANFADNGNVRLWSVTQDVKGLQPVVPLYRSPQPTLQQITPDDVTEEMLSHFYNGILNKENYAAIVNVWLKLRSVK